MATSYDGTLSAAASTIEGTAIWGSVMDGTFWPAYAVIKGVRTTSNPAARDPDLDITFNCLGYDRFGDPNHGVWFAAATISGSKSGTLGATNTITAEATISGTAIWGNVYSGVFTPCLATITGDLLLAGEKSGWVMWSKIGSMDFTVDGTNEAGERPLDGIGTVYGMAKLAKSIMVYGSNSVYMMQASEVFWGAEKVMDVGIANKGAFTHHDDAIHWFIDTQGVLWSYSEGPKKLDYSHLLGLMTTPRMFYSNDDDLIYICDGTLGYVYNPISGCMTSGPPTLSGISYKDGVLRVLGSAAITVPAFTFVSDVLDFGSRKEKTMFSVEIATDITEALSVRIHWREKYTDAFSTTPWHTFTERGEAYLPCYGIDFKFELKAAAFEAAKAIDYIKFNGIIHGFSYLDTARIERW